MKTALHATVIASTALFAISCGGEAERISLTDPPAAPSSGASQTVADQRGDQAQPTPLSASEAAGVYRGPSVGAARGFSALAHTAIQALNGASATGNLGVSGARTRSIVGFAPPPYAFGTDSAPPNSRRTVLTQSEVSALVQDLDARACNAHYTPAPGGTVTLHPGVTCLDATESAVSGRVLLDAQGDPNAFFLIRSELGLAVADGTELLLENGAQACGVFWHARKQVTIGAHVELLGTVIAGAGISMQFGSTLVGRLLAQTEAISLDANTILLPTFDRSGGLLTCSHEQ